MVAQQNKKSIPPLNMDTSTKTKTNTGAITALAIGFLLLGGIGYMLLATPFSKKKTTSTTTSTLTNTATTPATTTAVNNGIWISSAELAAIPITGETGCLAGSACAKAWDNLVSKANASWGTPDLACQTSVNAAYAVAGALVYARTGNGALRTKAASAIMAAKQSLDTSGEYDDINLHCGYRPRTLSLGRQLAGYVIAADLINLPVYDSVANAEFETWLKLVRDVELAGSNPTYGKSLRKTYENWSHNWSSFAGASMIAISRYLGETAYIARADAIWRSYGIRGVYPDDTWDPPGGQNTYFDQTSSSNTGKCLGNCLDEWKCDVANWTPFSPACVKTDADGDTGNIDGAFIEDVNRGPDDDISCLDTGPVGFFWNGGTEAMSSAAIPFNCGMQYEWSSIQGLFTQAEMLHRAGYDAYGANNQQLKRLMDFMVRAGWNMHYGASQNVPWIANYRFGTNYPTSAPPTQSPSYSIGWTDWTHASSPDTVSPTVSITVPTTGVSVSGIVSVTATATDNIGVVGVQFKLDGINLGAEDTSSPYSVSWDTTRTTGVSHTLTATVRDAAVNQTTSAGVSVTVQNGGGGGGPLRLPAD